MRVLLLLALALSIVACRPASTGTVVTQSEPHRLDRLIPEGNGPVSALRFTLTKTHPETLWITAVRIYVKDKDGRRLSREEASGFLGEGSLSFQYPERHAYLLGLEYPVLKPLVAFCSEVQEWKLPPGYGFPVRSNESLVGAVQWKNREPYLAPTELSLELEVDYTREKREPVMLRVVYAATEFEGVVQSRWRVPKGGGVQTWSLAQQLSKGENVRYAVPFGHNNLSSLRIVEREREEPLLEYTKGRALKYSLPLVFGDPEDYSIVAELSNEGAVETIGLGAFYLYVDDEELLGP